MLCFHYAFKEGELLILPKGLLLVSHEPSIVNTAPGPHIRGNTLRAYSMGDNEVDLLLPGTTRLISMILLNWFLLCSSKLTACYGCLHLSRES